MQEYISMGKLPNFSPADPGNTCVGRGVQRGAGGRFDAVCGVMMDRESGPC